MLVSKIFAMLRLYNARHVALVTRSSKRSSIILKSDFRNLESVSFCRYTKGANTTSTSNNENKGTESPEKGKDGILKRRVIPAVVVGGTAVVSAPLVLVALGFGQGGIAAGTLAATMASLYGGAVPAGSVLAILQSAGAAGIGIAGKVGIFSTTALSSCGIMEMGSRKKQKYQSDYKTENGELNEGKQENGRIKSHKVKENTK